MTIEEVRASTKPMLTPAEVAPIIGCDPQGIRITAREHPEWLHFPTICIKSRVKIPREAFLRYLDSMALS